MQVTGMGVHQVAAGHSAGLTQVAIRHPTTPTPSSNLRTARVSLGRRASEGPQRVAVRPRVPGRWLGLRLQGQAWLSCMHVCVHTRTCV